MSPPDRRLFIWSIDNTGFLHAEVSLMFSVATLLGIGFAVVTGRDCCLNNAGLAIWVLSDSVLDRSL